jgi:hypothetical protein
MAVRIKRPVDVETAVLKGLIPIRKGDKPRGTGHKLSEYYTIRKMLNNIADEVCPPEMLTVFRTYWPKICIMTMKEAWLRTVYVAAIGGNESAWYFIADRTEGKVREGSLENGKGLILETIDKLVDDKENTPNE